MPAPRRGTLSGGGGAPEEWLKAWPEDGSENYVEFGNRVVLQLKQEEDPTPLLAGRKLKLLRLVTPTTFILLAPDSPTALREAAALSLSPKVSVCHPVAKRRAALHSSYARPPNDPYFRQAGLSIEQWQWNLENRDENGTQMGADLNVRAAWPVSRGAGTTIAIVDDGFQMDHPDLAPQVSGAPHFNFHSRIPAAGPSGPFSNHGTAVAGLAAAAGDNRIGISGVAPGARLANWVLFNASDSLPDEERMMDMFQYQSNVVSVQNHSWGKVGANQLRVGALERIGISNAVTFGRSGRGVVIVRSAGNGRAEAGNAADDEYPSDPRVIAVGAARADGRVARYSNPGACVLVAGPSGDDSSEENPCVRNSPNLFTTDRTGSSGYNRIVGTDDLSNYGFGSTGFSGTSAATPQISGVVALILAANPGLAYRDVQQILVLSSRHFDLADPDLRRNGAGLMVSHNLGYGVPDAGVAVALARSWVNRPPHKVLTFTDANSSSIPDLAVRLIVEGVGVPPELASIPALPGSGVHPGDGTATLPIEEAGLALEPLERKMSGRAALVRRGTNFFCDKIAKVTDAGAALAIVYNHRDGNRRIVMGGIDFTTIPAVMISQNHGEALLSHMQKDPTTRVRLEFNPVRYSFSVADTLICEHVGVRLDTDHSRRGDLRVTLVSPMGTRSVLQFVNTDDAAGPVNWTYFSTQHFYESSAGTWTVEISDEDDRGRGRVKSIGLIIHGVPIEDSDRDGLDDTWEKSHFGTLDFRPTDDPDNDGSNNAREQAAGTDPNRTDAPFRIDLSVWNDRLARLSWPGTSGTAYQVRLGAETTAPLTVVTNIPGRFPQTEWFVPYTALRNQFFRVQALPEQQ